MNEIISLREAFAKIPDSKQPYAYPLEGVLTLICLAMMCGRHGERELSLRPYALKEQDQLEFEKHDRVNRGATPIRRVTVSDQIAYKGQIELGLDLAIEVVGRHQVFQANRQVGGERLRFVA